MILPDYVLPLADKLDRSDMLSADKHWLGNDEWLALDALDLETAKGNEMQA